VIAAVIGAPPAPAQDTARPVVGVVCEPHGEPVGIARRLAQQLRERLGGEHEGACEVHVHHERLPLTEDTHNAELLKHLGDLGRRNGWDLTLCIVDVPMRADGRPIVADAHLAGGAALLSLPAFGAMHLGRRVREVAEFVARIHARSPHPSEPANRSGKDGATVLAEPFERGPFEMVQPDADGIDLRILATRGRWRLLVGMVRANRPWRLVFGLTSALAAALAVGAYVLVNSGVWKLALALGALKLSAAALSAIALMVTWLIIDHGLWTRPVHTSRAGLYNASTVLTLLIGVLCMYAGVFGVVLAASTFTMDAGYFHTEIGRPLRPGDYLTVTWLASSMAIVAGALGTGFESEDAVRQAAYSYRERERRAAVEKSKDQSTRPA
jgi:hypothetical protein